MDGVHMLTYSILLTLVHQLDRCVAKREKRSVVAIEEESALQEQIAAVRIRLNRLAYLSAREVSVHVNAKPLTEAFFYMSSVGFVGSNIEHWAKILLESPVFEDGGPADFTRADKIREAKILIDAVKVRAWTWPEYKSKGEALDALLRVVEAPLQNCYPSSPFLSDPLDSDSFASAFFSDASFDVSDPTSPSSSELLPQSLDDLLRSLS